MGGVLALSRNCAMLDHRPNFVDRFILSVHKVVTFRLRQQFPENRVFIQIAVKAEENWLIFAIHTKGKAGAMLIVRNTE